MKNVNEPENDTVAALLNGLRPAAPSDALMRRLAAARPALRVVTRREKIILFIPRLATAAAVIALMGAISYKIVPRLLKSGEKTDVAQQPLRQSSPASRPIIAPVAVASISPMQTRQRLLGVQDIGVTLDSQQNAVRLMRAQWWDDETFAPANGAPPVRQERLREEIVPVAVSTF